MEFLFLEILWAQQSYFWIYLKLAFMCPMQGLSNSVEYDKEAWLYVRKR